MTSNGNLDYSTRKDDSLSNHLEESKLRLQEGPSESSDSDSRSLEEPAAEDMQPRSIPLGGSKAPKRFSLRVQHRKVIEGFNDPRFSLRNQSIASRTPVSVRKHVPRVPPSLTDTLGSSKETDADLRIETKKEDSINPADNAWNTLVFVANLYNFFVFFYAIALRPSFRDLALVLELVGELILLGDLGIYITMRCANLAADCMPLSQSSPWTWHGLVLRLVSSFPYCSVLAMVGDKEFPVYLVKGLKLLRAPSIISYLNKVQELGKGSCATLLQILKYTVIMLMFIHLIACGWLFTNSFEGGKSWKLDFGFTAASDLETYIASVFLIVGNMAGICFGDTYPVTVAEMLVYCAVVFCGCTALAALFGNLTNSIYLKNAKIIKNGERIEQIKNMAATRGLPEEFTNKLVSYYTELRVKFSKYEETYEIMQELPNSLRADLAASIHAKFAQRVKFFQQSDSGFVKAMVGKFRPMICLAGDYVVRKGEVALSMYFVKKGIVRTACADNESLAISYLNKGCYFGEIGTLLTGKRSVSVIAHTNCILFEVSKEDLEELLANYPSHRLFLESVGRQRLETTTTMDLVEHSNDFTCARSSLLGSQSLSASIVLPDASTRSQMYPLDSVHLSLRHVFNVLLLLSIVWNAIYTPFAICFKDLLSEGNGWIIALELASYLTFVADLGDRLRSRLTQESSAGSAKKQQNIFTVPLLLDIISILPIDYVCILAGYDGSWLRLLKHCKLHRLVFFNELLNSVLGNLHLHNIILLSLFYLFSSHFFACGMFFIASWVHSRGGRFDGASFFTSAGTAANEFGDFSNLPVQDQYLHCFYFSLTVMSSSVFGDIFPMTAIEQAYVCVVILIAKLFMAFMFSEVSNFMSSFYVANIEHLGKTQQIVKLLKLSGCDEHIVGRVERYRGFLWRKLKGVDDQSLISSMPETVRHQTQYHILENLVKKAEVIPKDDYGAVLSIVKVLSIKLYSEGEFIIREGEIATEMFFLIEGVVDIYGNEGAKIARLSEGQCFGEMALLSETVPLRTASAFSVTDVSVAVLKKEDFDTICDLYPLFKKKILEIASKRQSINFQRATTTGTNHDSSGKFKRRATIVLRSTIQNKLTIDAEVQEKLQAQRCRFRLPHLFVIFRAAAFFYNAIFIPLQMAFRFEYTVSVCTLEALVLCLHLYDLVLAVLTYRRERNKTQQVQQMPDTSSRGVSQTSTACKSELKKLRKCLLRTILECVTLLPMAWILSALYYPLYLLAFFKLLRVFKVWPLRKALSYLKQQWINLGRIIEITVYYLLITHMLNCLLIMMMYATAYRNDSWVKRVPAPDMDEQGYRQGNDMGTATWYQIYMHFSAQDENAINVTERLVLTIYTAVFMYVYVFLFANVTSMVTDSSRNLMANLQHRYQELMTAVNANKMPRGLLERIEYYFQYLWVNSKGIDEKLLEELPDTIRSDIIFRIHESIVRNSLLFADEAKSFDKGAAASLIRVGTLSRLMKGDIIMKAGSVTRKTLLVLEGELTIVGIDEVPIARISPGGWFSYNIPDMNWTSGCTVYVVASEVSRVVIVPADRMERLLIAYMEMRTNFFECNEFLVKLCLGRLKESRPELQDVQDEIDAAMEEEFANLSLEKTAAIVRAATAENKADTPTLTELMENAKGISRALSVTARDSAQEQASSSESTHRFYIDPSSVHNIWIYLFHLASIICTSVIEPLQLCFGLRDSWVYYLCESTCLLESAFHVLVRCRTPVLLKGPVLSYDLRQILHNYREYGLAIDLLGLVPLNLVFTAVGVVDPLWIVVPLRLVRMALVGNIPKILGYVKLRCHKLSSAISILTLFASYFLLWHWISCFWLFLNHYVEKDEAVRWLKAQKLEDASTAAQYVYSIYYIIKLVAGVTSGETTSVTIAERCHNYIVARIGDLVFAVLFGLIAAFAASLGGDSEQGIIQTYKIEEFSREFGLSHSDKRRVEHYFSFLQALTCCTNLEAVVHEQLPKPLAKETVYELNRPLVAPMFKQIASDAFIRKVTQNLITAYYMPGDYIVRKGDVGEEMYFLAEGRVAIVASNKRTVLKRLYPGSYFGDIALFLQSRRICHVRAETCCCVRISI